MTLYNCLLAELQATAIVDDGFFVLREEKNWKSMADYEAA